MTVLVPSQSLPADVTELFPGSGVPPDRAAVAAEASATATGMRATRPG